MNNILLCATNLSAKAVRRWLEACQASSVESLKVPITNGAAHFWMIVSELTRVEIIQSLDASGVIAEARDVAGLKAVYVPPQSIARQKGAHRN